MSKTNNKLIIALISILLIIALTVGVLLISNNKTSDNDGWDFESGVLTVTCDGSMESWESEIPWENIKPEIKEVVIENKTTDICAEAFKDCTGLEEVSIGKSVKKIGESAFANCSKLKEITIPESVETVEVHAFSECKDLVIKVEHKTLPSGFAENWCDNEAQVMLVDVDEPEASTDADYSPETEADKISAEEAAEKVATMLMSRKSEWAGDYLSFAPYSIGFTFIDIDFDGIPEFFSGGCDGSARISVFSVYKINTSFDNYSRITVDNSEGFYDLAFSNNPLQLYYNSQAKEYEYWGQDSTNAGTYGSGTDYGTLKMANNSLIQSILFSKGQTTEDPSVSEPVDYYKIFNGDMSNTVSKTEYDNAWNSYFETRTSADLKYKEVRYREFNSSSESEQKNLIKEAYLAFSYTKIN